MSSKPGSSRIVILIDADGDCSVNSPPEMQLDEVVDILTAALDAAITKSDEQRDRKKELEQTLSELQSKRALKN